MVLVVYDFTLGYLRQYCVGRQSTNHSTGPFQDRRCPSYLLAPLELPPPPPVEVEALAVGGGVDVERGEAVKASRHTHISTKETDGVS